MDCSIFRIWILDLGRGVTSPYRPGEPAGGVGGTARPQYPKAFLYIEKVRTPSGKPGCGELYSGVKVLGSGLQSLRYESLDADVDTDSNGYIDADMDSDTIAYIDVNVPHISMQIDMNLNMGTYIWIHRRM